MDGGVRQVRRGPALGLGIVRAARQVRIGRFRYGFVRFGRWGIAWRVWTDW